jgi:signal recognition particle subunit SRP54
MGDVLTLIEQAEKVFEADQQERMTAKLVGGEQFTLDDFLEQLIAIRRMGPIGNLLSMMPGAGQLKDQIADIDDKHLDRVTAIIRSMTPAERGTPKIINGSRRVRIANGSGTTVTDVNQLLERFTEAQKMMKQMGGMMGLPGRRKATKSPKNKRKGKKGKQQNRQPRSGGMPALPPGLGGLPGAGAGAGGSGDGKDNGLPPGFQMPKIDLSKFGKK